MIAVPFMAIHIISFGHVGFLKIDQRVKKTALVLPGNAFDS